MCHAPQGFDVLVSAGGLVVAIVLTVAGALAMWGYDLANSNVHDQLAQQQITFPAAGSPELASPKIGPTSTSTPANP